MGLLYQYAKCWIRTSVAEYAQWTLISHAVRWPRMSNADGILSDGVGGVRWSWRGLPGRHRKLYILRFPRSDHPRSLLSQIL